MADPRIAVLSALSSPSWHPVPEAHGMPWDEAEQLLAAYDASRDSAASPVPPATHAADSPSHRAGLRDQIRRAVCEAEGFAWDSDMLEPDEYGEHADTVLAVLYREWPWLRAEAEDTEPADRAAVERIRAVLETEAVVGRSALEYRGLIASALMADEAQQPTSKPAASPSNRRALVHNAITDALSAAGDWVPLSIRIAATRAALAQVDAWHADDTPPADEAQQQKPGRSDVGTEFVRHTDHLDGEALARVEAELEQSGVDTPGCDCGHDGMGAKWHMSDCLWRCGQHTAEAQQQPDTETQAVPEAEDPARIDRLRPEFTDHASVESIDVQLRRARSQQRRWHQRVEWLISLRQARVMQKELGEWPVVVSQPGKEATR